MSSRPDGSAGAPPGGPGLFLRRWALLPGCLGGGPVDNVRLTGTGRLRCRMGALWRFRKLARLGVCVTLSPDELRLVAGWIEGGAGPRAPP